VRAVAAGGTAIPPATPGAQAILAARLDPEDLPILAMLLDGTEPDEIARVLGIRPSWLDARRWAMLERVRRLPTRRRSGAGQEDLNWPNGALPA
jgi:hypothetical protein